MNRSEEKQVFLLGRILRRDLKRVSKLVNSGELKVPQEAIEFSRVVIELSGGAAVVDNQLIERAYQSTKKDKYEKYLQVKELLVTQ